MTKTVLTTIIRFAIVMFILASSLALYQSQREQPSADTGMKPHPTLLAQEDRLAQVSRHNTPSDCWVSYRGNAYNITFFFGKHPGGDSHLVKYCGKDITTAFETMDKRKPELHSQRARQILESFLLR